jgi:2-oxoglutarate ferredoxin oxidoreductase subunit alpha
MREISILIGGEAGDGTKLAGKIIGRILNRMGYFIFVYDDYQSLIRGGHNFSIIRASEEKIKVHENEIDVLIALNQETIDFHKKKLKKKGLIIFDSNLAKTEKGIGIEMSKITQDYKLPQVLRNSIAIGALAKIFGIDFKIVEAAIKQSLASYQKENIRLAKVGFKNVSERFHLKKLKREPKPLLTGNEAIALGALKAGLSIYIAYPMTPSTSILHFLVKHKDELGIQVIQPENEISAVLMMEGAVYAGKRAMVGTSGGGFALMTEALSLAGMAELPAMFVLSQRAAPSTGVPTYTMQADLLFALHAGHGEFQRIVAAPGDVNQAFYLAGQLLNLSWQFQVPSILLSDKHLSESTFSADFKLNEIKEKIPKLWNKGKGYKRYLITKDGVSPLAFPGQKDVVVKTTSYEHDEYGITTEKSEDIRRMIEKRKRKREAIIKTLKKMETVKVSGRKNSRDILITWGSNIGAVEEVANDLGFKVVQPLYLEPFPFWEIEKEVKGAKRIIDIETNSGAQLVKVLKCYGIEIQKTILKYDARPFTPKELKKKI